VSQCYGPQGTTDRNGAKRLEGDKATIRDPQKRTCARCRTEVLSDSRHQQRAACWAVPVTTVQFHADLLGWTSVKPRPITGPAVPHRPGGLGVETSTVELSGLIWRSSC
jgi:hypothetical protein